MYFHLRSEIERTDPFKNHTIKRVYCPSCGKVQIKKVYEDNYYIKYKSWNKNCEGSGDFFVLINDYLKNEDQFNGNCEVCNKEYYREFIEVDGAYGRLVFKCVNNEFDESNYKLSYDFESDEWIKRDILSDCDFQYIHWYLYRKPGEKEFNILNAFFEENGFKLIKESAEKETIDYRLFLENKVSIHFKVSAKSWGFGIIVIKI